MLLKKVWQSKSKDIRNKISLWPKIILCSLILRDRCCHPPSEGLLSAFQGTSDSPLSFFRQPSCASARRRLIKWKLHSFCIPFIVRRHPSLGLSPLGVAWPTETTAHGLLNENFPSMVAKNFREFIDELHYNCCRRVKSCF